QRSSRDETPCRPGPACSAPHSIPRVRAARGLSAGADRAASSSAPALPCRRTRESAALPAAAVRERSGYAPTPPRSSRARSTENVEARRIRPPARRPVTRRSQESSEVVDDKGPVVVKPRQIKHLRPFDDEHVEGEAACERAGAVRRERGK